MVEHPKSWLDLTRDRRAVTALEYALIAGLIAVVISFAVLRTGSGMAAIFTTLANTIGSA